MIKVTMNTAVGDVRKASAWYQFLLGCGSAMSDSEDEHRGLFDLLVDENRNTVIVLSKWDHNPLVTLQSKENAIPGHGVQLFFSVSDHASCWNRAKELSTEVMDEPHPSRGFEIP